MVHRLAHETRFTGEVAHHESREVVLVFLRFCFQILKVQVTIMMRLYGHHLQSGHDG